MCWSTGREPIGAAARQRHARLAEARQQRPQHQDGGAHRLDQFVGRFVRGERRGVQPHLLGLRVALHHLHAQAAQQLEHGVHVLQLRRVVQGDGLGREQRRTQFGQGCILRAGNGDLALERAATADEKFVHETGSGVCPMLTRPSNPLARIRQPQ